MELLERARALRDAGRICPRYERIKKKELHLSAVHHAGEHLGLVARPDAALFVFAGCNMRCTGCLYYEWSHKEQGLAKDAEQLTKLFLRMVELERERVVLMNASHYLAEVLQALEAARALGFTKPVVWYTTGYETEEALEIELLAFDIFGLDLKTVDPGWAQRYLATEDYVDVATKSARMIYTAKPREIIGGALYSGLVVRHLVLPVREAQDNALQVLTWCAENLPGVRVELVRYVPAPGPGPRAYTPTELLGELLERGKALGLEVAIP